MPPPFARVLPAARDAARSIAPRSLELTEQIAAVAAPTGDEAARGRLIADLFRASDPADVAVDDLGDVVARIPGRVPGPPLLVAAHLDTVFPAETPLPIRRTAGGLAGPGVGDNSLGLAALLSLPALFAAMGVTPAVDVLLAATVGEEGLGNLRGMRTVVDARPNLGAAIAVEGHNLGRVTHVAVGSQRLRLRLTGPGGHSWGDHGRPSAIHALARLVADLAALPLPPSPKTTLNVGLIEGGLSVNTIAPTACCVVDLRSVDTAALEHLAARVERAVGQAGRGGLAATREVLGERPAGVVARDSRVVRVASEALDALGVEPVCDASSTDANIPISRGIPAVCLGLTTGGNVHRPDEYIDTAPVPTGLAQLVLVAHQLAEDLAAGRLMPAKPTQAGA